MSNPSNSKSDIPNSVRPKLFSVYSKFIIQVTAFTSEKNFFAKNDKTFILIDRGLATRIIMESICVM